MDMSNYTDSIWAENHTNYLIDPDDDYFEGLDFESGFECSACFGTGMDRHEDADCMNCWGEGRVYGNI